MITLGTERLDILPLRAELARALSRADRDSAHDWTAARFPEPFRLPPLLDEDIGRFADALAREPDRAGWWGWLVVARKSQDVVGFVLCAEPEADGFSLVGWSLYPPFEGHGYATEAMQGLFEWLFAHEAVKGARATIPPMLTRSLRVAEKLQMVRTGTRPHREFGSVGVYDRLKGVAVVARQRAGRQDG